MLGELQLATAAPTERQVGFDGALVAVVQLVIQERPELLDGCTAADHPVHGASSRRTAVPFIAPDSIA